MGGSLRLTRHSCQAWPTARWPSPERTETPYPLLQNVSANGRQPRSRAPIQGVGKGESLLTTKHLFGIYGS